MKTLKTFGLLLIIVLFTTTSCKGPKGDPGHNGNANVQSSTVETISTDWIWDNNSSNWYLDLGWDAIDVDMVDHGAALVYMENPGEFYGWHQLPLTLYPNDQYSTTLETIYYDLGLTIFWTNSDLQQHQNPCDFYNSNITFKIILIDASTYSKLKDEDLRDYETVKKLFNIREENH